MKEFLISAKVTISVYTKVESETLEEAISIAEERMPMSIVSNGSDNENENWMVDEIDGTPYELHEE